MVHVPFRGAGPAAQAVVGKQIQLGSVALAAAESMIQSGQLRALAVTSEKRWFSLPNVPTMIEAGYPGFVSDTFNALLAPAGVPQPILAMLVKETPRRVPEAGSARASPQVGFRGRGRDARTACSAHQGGNPGGSGVGGQGRHPGTIRIQGERAS